MSTIVRAAAAWMVSAALIFPTVAAPDDVDRAAAVAEPKAAATTVDAAFDAIVADDELDRARGGSDLHVNQNNLDAILEGNVAANLTTGDNTITEGAFTNTTGIPMVIQNSGNNVIIQNSTILNLELH